MFRTTLVLAFLAACDLTTHGEREAVANNPDTLGLCCLEPGPCVQPRVAQDVCDPGTIECTGESVGLGGPLWECRESSPVTAKIVTSASSLTQGPAILHGTIAAQGLGR
jgi:hypothetical protein